MTTLQIAVLCYLAAALVLALSIRAGRRKAGLMHTTLRLGSRKPQAVRHG